jgi:ADP-heptose:LPS heptosyltransferase
MSRSTGLQRQLDRYVGDALAMAFRVRGSATAKIMNPARVGIIQPTAIGDLVLASGLISHVHAQYPRAEIHLLVGPSNRAALDLLEFHVTGHTLNFTKPASTLKAIRALELDVLVDLVPWSGLTALLCRFSGASLTCGFAPEGRFRHLLFSRAVKYSRDVHQSENFRILASLLGPLGQYEYRLRQNFPEPAITLPYDRLIVCHMRPGGSQARAKAWPADRWADLASRLCDEGYAVVFSGSASDREPIDQVIAQIESPGRECYSLAGELTLSELSFVFQHARLVVSVDTSPLHLASAIGVPVVGIHGPTLSRQWGAISANSRSVDALHPAAGYINFGFEDHPRAREVMRSISVEEVYEVASSLLAKERAVRSPPIQPPVENNAS